VSNEYATLDELKAHLGISDTVDDAVLTIANEAISEAINGYCGRRFWVDQQAAARVFKADDPVELNVPDFTDAQSLVVETDDNADGTYETTWSSTDYQLEPLNANVLGRPWRQIIAIDARIWPTGVWLAGSPFRHASYPTRLRRACVRITAKWGWPAVPASVKEAQLLQAARIFKRKDAPFGTTGSPEFGVIRMLASRLDPDTKVLLEQFLPEGARAPSTSRVR
jgi:hypothetical protein